jgi:iron(III) transport system permease protein
VRNSRRYILAVLCGLYLGLFLLLPIAMAIREGFLFQGGWSLIWIQRVFTDLASREGLVNSLRLAGITTLVVFVVALPLAAVANQYSFRGKNLLSALLMVPMILPPFVGALAMRQILARESGSINLLLAMAGLPKLDFLGSGLPGVVVLEVLHLYPILYLNAVAALANVDPTLIEAARGLGASHWTVFRRIVLPLIRPGLFAGGTIVFIWSFCELGTPAMLGYDQVLPVQIFHGLNVADTSPDIYAMVFVLLGASVGMNALGKFLFGRPVGGATVRGVAAQPRRAGVVGTGLIWLLFAAVTLVAMTPHVGVVLMSFSRRWSGTILPESYTLQYVRQVFQQERTWRSIVNSLHYASLATVVDVVAGLTIAVLVVRMKIRGGWLLDSAAMLPLAVPGLVIASGYIVLTSRPPEIPYLKELLEQYSPRQNPALILIIAYSIRRLPYMVRSISAGLEQTSPTLEEAARNLGAGPLRTLLRVTVPLISANVLAGAILAFSFAMLEVSDSLILAQTPPYYPITKTIYTLASVADTQNLAAALGMFGMVLLTATLAAASLLLGRRMGAMFRV